MDVAICGGHVSPHRSARVGGAPDLENRAAQDFHISLGICQRAADIRSNGYTYTIVYVKEENWP